MQGIRRVVAVTGVEAEAAMSKAEGLTVAVDAALGMRGPQLEATATALRLVGAGPVRISCLRLHWDLWGSSCTQCGVHAQDVEGSALPAAAKAALRAKLGTLQKRVAEDMKAAAAANKARASSAAVQAADSAVAAGDSFAVLQLEVRYSSSGHRQAGTLITCNTLLLMRAGCGAQVGLDTKAVMEAWQAISRKHPTLPATIITADAGELPAQG